MKDDYTTNSYYLTYTVIFIWLGECMYFLNVGVMWGLRQTHLGCIALVLIAQVKRFEQQHPGNAQDTDHDQQGLDHILPQTNEHMSKEMNGLTNTKTHRTQIMISKGWITSYHKQTNTWAKKWTDTWTNTHTNKRINKHKNAQDTDHDQQGLGHILPQTNEHMSKEMNGHYLNKHTNKQTD